MQSEQINELSAALVAFQGEMGTVPKGSVNPFFKSKYADLADVKVAASPVAAKHGLAVTQFPTTQDGEPALMSMLVHSSGQWISDVAKLMVKTTDPQGQGSGLTYMRRYAYCSILGIVADEDDDGNKGSSKPVERPSGQSQGNPSDPRLEAILAAEGSGNTFVDDICAKYRQYGKLSENQIAKAFEAATKPRNPVRIEDSDRQAQLIRIISGFTDEQKAELSDHWDDKGLPSIRTGMNTEQLDKAESLVRFLSNPAGE